MEERVNVLLCSTSNAFMYPAEFNYGKADDNVALTEVMKPS